MADVVQRLTSSVAILLISVTSLVEVSSNVSSDIILPDCPSCIKVPHIDALSAGVGPRYSGNHTVCHSQLRAAHAVGLRSICPWHYERITLHGDNSHQQTPGTVLSAQLLCGSRCLKLTSSGEKRRSALTCLPVNRYDESVLSCCTVAGVGRRCCWQPLPVPVAYTCAFP